MEFSLARKSETILDQCTGKEYNTDAFSGGPAIRSIHTLLRGIVDYAGLFPPAKLSMGDSVERYARAQSEPARWMLGRFILPAARFDEFDEAVLALRAQRDGPAFLREGIWRLSVLPGEDIPATAARIAAFRSSHRPGQGEFGALVESIEGKASTAEAAREATRALPDDVELFFEVPPQSEPELFQTLAALGVRGKIRTGSVVPGAIPSSEAVAQFIERCEAAHLRFKATAGLHHPVRSERPLTYEPDSPRDVLHGFLNVFLCAGLVLGGEVDHAGAVALLDETDPRAFRFAEEEIGWRDHSLTVDAIEKSRTRFALSFGSCSFDEPIDDLRELRLL